MSLSLILNDEPREPVPQASSSSAPTPSSSSVPAPASSSNAAELGVSGGNGSSGNSNGNGAIGNSNSSTSNNNRSGSVGSAINSGSGNGNGSRSGSASNSVSPKPVQTQQQQQSQQQRQQEGVYERSPYLPPLARHSSSGPGPTTSGQISPVPPPASQQIMGAQSPQLSNGEAGMSAGAGAGAGAGASRGRQRSGRMSGMNGSGSGMEYSEERHSRMSPPPPPASQYQHHPPSHHQHHAGRGSEQQQETRYGNSGGSGSGALDLRERETRSGTGEPGRRGGRRGHSRSHSRSGSPQTGYYGDYGGPSQPPPFEPMLKWRPYEGKDNERGNEPTRDPVEHSHSLRANAPQQNESGQRMESENGHGHGHGHIHRSHSSHAAAVHPHPTQLSHAHAHSAPPPPLQASSASSIQPTQSGSGGGRQGREVMEGGGTMIPGPNTGFHHSPRPAHAGGEYDGYERDVRGASGPPKGSGSRHAQGGYYTDEGYDAPPHPHAHGQSSVHGHGHTHGQPMGHGQRHEHSATSVPIQANVDRRSVVNGDAEDEYPPSVQTKRKKLDHTTGAGNNGNGVVAGAPPVKRRSRRTKQNFTPPVEQPGPVREPTAEELRLASSDLEDCPEIWYQELGAYLLETQKKQRQVEFWFEDGCLARNNEIAKDNAKKYATRIGQIPPPAPRPVYVPPQQNFEHEYRRRSRSPGYHDPNGIDLEFENMHAPGHSQYTEPIFNADNENAARELEESILGPSSSRHGQYEGRKRDAASALSDESVDMDLKRRKFEEEEDITDEVEKSIAGDDTQSVSAVQRRPQGGKGKGRVTAGTPSVAGSDVGGPGKARRRIAQRKKGDAYSQLAQEGDRITVTSSVAGDRTPTPSVPPSPALSATLIYEIGDVIPPLKRAKKVDDQVMAKRIQGLEEAQKKVWLNIARRDVAKVYKHHISGFQIRINQTKRIAALCASQAKKTSVRTVKSTKETQTRAKRLMREMMVFWKKNEKEERELKKKAEKEADNRAKEEEEKREAARQARKLEFLISQTELYSHFVGNKLKTAEIEGESGSGEVPKGAEGPVDEAALEDINFDDSDMTNLHNHAWKNAKEAIELAKNRAVQFDTQAALERKTNEALALAKAQAHVRDDDEFVEGGEKGGKGIVDLDSDELNFQNPTSLTGPLTIGQPKMLQAQLKEYQLKGLNWLGTLYEQGINGILADEMGLGKTVQSISLLAHLAETHDIWGPFLVVAPASTLHNWQQELTKFVPRLKALPYWGNVKDRATLRKFWSKKEISYNQDAPFHVLITSYQLVTQDQQYFQRVKWQYMVLDEAQNIKNSSSARWKTLLGFHCRNRLLLTGTPIQNNMQELWALLHFIMPSLFDSHDEFNEWFSKDIENAAAENKGSKLNEHQLRRLHMILKPFMLRRVKRHVQNELSEKIEIDIYVSLSARQRALYKALRDNISVADLIEKASHIGDADAARTLMNLVMQFRKVCNHPELFERADVVAPFSFSEYGRPGSIAREGDFVACHYSTRSPIEVTIPETFYLDGGLLSVPHEDVTSKDFGPLRTMMNIWSSDWIQKSLENDVNSPFNFIPLLGMSPGEAHRLHFSPTIHRLIFDAASEQKRLEDPFVKDPFFDAFAANDYYRIGEPFSLRHFDVADDLPALHEISTVRWAETCLSRPILRWYVPPVIAPPSSMYTTNRNFVEQQANLLEAPEESLVLYGLPPFSREDKNMSEMFERKFPGIPVNGLLGNSPVDQLPLSYMQVPEAKRLIYDSAKLARLDALLHELKAGDHRVLIYFQMTRMMDLMEEYLIYRQYKYLRLDGSSKLEDRRDMVIDWQTKPDIFVFLLSTRAGGLGINLTAADTVVFYDHDWNPSNDAQAMDRAHRLGQTRQVTVYRLITKGTIDERIVQLARVKKDVQDIVVGNKQFTDVTKPNEIVSLLLNDDELANLEKQGVDESGVKKSSNRPTDGTSQAVRDLWADEGDDFFGNSGNANSGSGSGAGAGTPVGEMDEDGTPVPSGSVSRGKRRGRGGAGAGGSRGRTGMSRRGSKRKLGGGGENFDE